MQINFIEINMRPVAFYSHTASAEEQSVTVNATGCGFNPHSKKLNIYLNLYSISSLWCRGKARR